MFDVNNKFNIDDNCFTYARVPIKHVCPVCNGEKKITFNGYEMKCPYCCGSGKIHKAKEFEYRVFQVFIYGIRVSLNNAGNIHIRYKLKCADETVNISSRAESNLFYTYDDAQSMADALNDGTIKTDNAL